MPCRCDAMTEWRPRRRCPSIVSRYPFSTEISLPAPLRLETLKSSPEKVELSANEKAGVPFSSITRLVPCSDAVVPIGLTPGSSTRSPTVSSCNKPENPEGSSSRSTALLDTNDNVVATPPVSSSVTGTFLGAPAPVAEMLDRPPKASVPVPSMSALIVIDAG